MRVALQYALWPAGLLLQVLVIRALLSGPYKRFVLLFAYNIGLFLTTIVEVAAVTAFYAGSGGMVRSWRYYYWADDALLQALIYAVVISLVYEAIGRTQARSAMRRWLVAGAVVIFAAIFLAHSGPIRDLSKWMTLVSRDLSFAAIILDFLLWSKLIASRKKDYQLLMLSGGLGIQFAGSALGQSMRDIAAGAMSQTLSLTGSIVVVLSNFACLGIWWQTFRRPETVAAGNKAQVAGNS